MVKCKQCGNDFDEQFGVCPKCGTVYEAEEKLPEIKPPADTLPELKDYSAEKPAAKKESKAKLFVIIGIIAALVIAGIIVCVILVNSNKGGTSEYKDQISLGQKYLSEENYDDAIAAFKKAIEIDSNDPDGYIGLADVYIAIGDKDKAVNILEEGYEKTGSDKIKTKLDSLKSGNISEDSLPEESKSEESSREEYQSSDYTLGTIVFSGTFGDNLTWQLDENGLLVISGSGKMRNFIDAPWYREHESIKTVIINKGVTNIGESSFKHCSSLKSISIPDSVTSIEDCAFYESTSLERISIPNSVTNIGVYAFLGCSSLTNITIPDSVTGIGEGAFMYCSSLTSITIPDSVTSIGISSFEGCASLTNITIPYSVTSIGESAFFDWTSSQTIYIKGRNEAPSGWDSKWNNYCDAKIVWDAESNNTSKPETSKEESIKAEPVLGTIVASGNYGENGDNVTWQLDDKGLLVISGSGNTMHYIIDKNDIPWAENRGNIKTVFIKDGVTSIESYAFYDCKNLSSITIPEGVTKLGPWAFAGCTSLKSITIPESLVYMSGGVFEEWTASQTIYIKGKQLEPINWHGLWNAECSAKIVWNA